MACACITCHIGEKLGQMKSAGPDALSRRHFQTQPLLHVCSLSNTTVYIVDKFKSLFETSSLSRCLEVHKVC